MHGTKSGALGRAVLVAKAACASVGKRVSAGAVGTALAVMLSLGGCSQSHTNLPDLDGDGYDRGVDCNDDDPSIHPGVSEGECPDGIDQDCDGHDGNPDIICNFFPIDNDGDGWVEGDDCDDTDPNTYPGAPEDCCEGIDRNCDGFADMCTNCFPEAVDADGDGYYDSGWVDGEIDCDDTNPDVNPGAEEICYDGLDNDCSGGIDDGVECPIINPIPDADGDGYTIDVDCDDSNPFVNPGIEFDCVDSLDNDCDGVADEDAEADECLWFMNGMLDVDALEAEDDAPVLLPGEGEGDTFA
ncbi:MAG: putative metal-binding motif-containing protein [Deltaproteobacteria bacterium]|nr:putative metal-binding motif-containing protein [Deltaproteobacteria bacterium]